MLTGGIGLTALLILLVLLCSIQLYNTFKIKYALGHAPDSKSSNKAEEQLEVYSNQMVELQNELDELKNHLKFKTVELAKAAKENDEITQLLNEVKDKVMQCAENPSSLSKVSRDVLAMLDSANISQDSAFEIQLDELHQEFSQNLKLKYPDLTIHDLRLATYIRIGLNSKEIADLLTIKPSSVYISRSRLRKKLELDTDTDLHGYLNTI